MNKQLFIKLIVFGIVQWFALNIIIFVVSLVIGVKDRTEMGAPPALGFVGVAAIMIIISYFFGKQLKLASRKQAIIAGLFWSGITTVFMLVTVFVNSTQEVILGNWGIYLVLVAQAIGTIFISIKKINTGNSPSAS